MNIWVKLLIGVVLLVVPLALYVYNFVAQDPIFSVSVMGKEIQFRPWESVWIVIQGTVPLFIMLVGLFVIWLELDEWRIERELREEEEKEEEKKPGRRGRKKK